MPGQSAMTGPGTRLRAVWAGAEFSGLRAAVGRAVDATPLGRAREAGAPIGEGAVAVEGRLSVCPMSGAVFDGRARLSPGWREARPVDWLVRAFPSRQAIPEVCPLWFGARADTVAVLAEALPRALALRRLAPEAVALVSVALGRLDRMQEALGAGVFAPVPVKVQPWERLVLARRAVWLRPGAAGAGDLMEAGARLRAAFGAGGEGEPVAVVAGGATRAARLGLAGGRVLDPESTPLGELVRAVAAAPRLIVPDTGEAALTLLRAGPQELAEVPAGGRDGRGRAVAEALGRRVEPLRGVGRA